MNQKHISKFSTRVTRWSVINHLRSQVWCSWCVRTQHLVLRKNNSGNFRVGSGGAQSQWEGNLTKGEHRFGWDKLLHRRSAGCSRNELYRNLPLCMLPSSTHPADTHTGSHCSLLPLNNKNNVKGRDLTQPEMLSNYAAQIKNVQEFPRMI